MDDTPPEEQTQGNQTRQLGKGMIIIAWVLIFGMLVWFFGVLEKNKRNPNQNISTQVLSTGEKEVVLESGAYGHYVATGKINRTEVTFLVDTGASYVSVPEGVAKKVGLKKGAEMLVSTANGSVSVYATILEEVSIGEIKLYDIKADINPHMDGDEILLGMSFLRDLSITHKGNQLTIRQ
ncbi:MAG: TIGR02281 family clan AA aspartic protease [Gammaproteobacteria bacterium]|nr:MAG: TIGR02281 family clan AA aspartic protease [Gammaproteobacteria bacterium]